MTTTLFRKFLLLSIFINVLLAPQGVRAQDTAEQGQELHALERKLKTAPNDFDLKLKHAQILGDSKRFAEEFEEGKGLVLLRPDDPDAYAVLEQGAAGIEKFDEALKASNKLIQMGFSTPQVYALHSGYLFSLRRYADAIKSADKAFELARTDLSSNFDQAQAHYWRASSIYHVSGPSKAVISELEQADLKHNDVRLEQFIRRVKAELSEKTLKRH
jgi:tetratricopeptide (TPR) repeat protein